MRRETKAGAKAVAKARERARAHARSRAKARSPRRKPTQTQFEYRTWGGKRKGAGRKPRIPGRPGIPHRSRPSLDPRHPAHVSLTVERELPGLRSPAVSGIVADCLRRGRERKDFRLCHYSIQDHHLHLVVEADGAEALSRGLRALSICIAMRLNRALGRKGRVFSDRYYARALKSPTEVRASLRYVLGNLRRHSAQRGEKIAWNWIDRLSSGLWFDGWKDARPIPLPEQEPPVAKAATWLLRTGWKLRGLIPINEVPGGKAGR